jgi:N-methylhydantoinase B
MNIPVESVEMNFPLRIPRMRLWTGPGGAGRFRGGLAAWRRSSKPPPPTSRSPTAASAAPPPLAARGGAASARAHAVILRADGTRENLPSKKMLVLHAGDQLWEYIAGRRVR